MFRSCSVRTGPDRLEELRSGGTERILFDRPLVLYELTIVKPTIEGSKIPLGVKGSRAMISFLPKSLGSKVRLYKKVLKT